MNRIAVGLCLLVSVNSFAACPYDTNCLNNPYGAGSPYKVMALKILTANMAINIAISHITILMQQTRQNCMTSKAIIEAG